MSNTPFVSFDNLLELLEWRSNDGILSLYVDVQRENKDLTQKWKSIIKSELNRLESQYPDNRKVQAAVAQAEEDLLEYPIEDRKRSLVYIRNSTTGKKFVKSIQAPLKTSAVWMNTAYLRPLISMLDESPVLGIVVVSKEDARILTWRQGMISENEERRMKIDMNYAEEMNSSMHTAGATVDLYANKVAVQVKKNLAELAKEVVAVAETSDWQSLMLFGSQRYTNTLEDHLPTFWQDKVIGLLDKNYINSSLEQIAESTTELLCQWKRRLEETLVKSTINTAGAKGRATIGVQETLDALQQYRVEHLIFSSDLNLTGWKDGGDLLVANVPEDQQDNMTKEPYLIERMIELAYAQDARVTPLYDPSSETLKKHGGVAALLRY